MVHKVYINIQNINRIILCIPLLTKLQDVTCHMGSHSVTCHLTQVKVPCLNPSQTGWYSINLPWKDGRLSWPRWLVTQWDSLSVVCQQTVQQLISYHQLSRLRKSATAHLQGPYHQMFVWSVEWHHTL